MISLQLKSSAFAMLVVMIVTSGLMMLTLALWFKTSLFVDIQNNREQYQKHFYLSEAVLHAGFELIKKNKTYFFSQKYESDEFKVQAPFLTIDKTLNATVLVSRKQEIKNKHILFVQSKLFESGNCVTMLSCCLNQKKNGDQDDTLVVDYFTFGTGV